MTLEQFISRMSGEMQKSHKVPCGDCTFCCRVPAISPESNEFLPAHPIAKEIEKGPNEPCKYCDLKGGCKVYEDRPSLCTDFLCFYAMGMIPYKPEDLGVCFSLQEPLPTPAGIMWMIMAHCENVREAIKKYEVQRVILSCLQMEKYYSVVLRDDKVALRIGKDGNHRIAEIDQSDPYKLKVLEDTERPWDPTDEELGL